MPFPDQGSLKVRDVVIAAEKGGTSCILTRQEAGGIYGQYVCAKKKRQQGSAEA